MRLTDVGWGIWVEDQLEDTVESAAITSEEVLIQRCLEGEEVAYSVLYRRLGPYIFRLIYGLLQHQQDAEEVLQDSFEYAFRRLDRFDADRASFKTWLYQIAVSRSRNKRRRKWLPTISLSQTGENELADRAVPDPEARLALTEQQRAVWEALQELSPRLRETAVLRYYVGLTFVEIGQVLDIPAKTAQSRVRLAHKQLEVLIDEETI